MANDLTKGSVTKTLLRFTIPFLIANVLHSVYGVVDMYIVGKYSTSAALSAVSVGSGLMLFFNLMLVGFGNGVTILVGQMTGGRREKDLRETLSTVFCLFPLIGLVIAVPCLIFGSEILRALNAPQDSFANALDYFRICLLGLIFNSVYTCIAGALRGMGDSSGPTIFVACACVFNIIADFILVAWLQMGAAGAAIATSLAQGLSAGVGLVYLKRKDFPLALTRGGLRIYGDKLKLYFSVGGPTALQETMTNVSFLVLEAVINRFGLYASAAAGVCDRLFSIAIIPSLAFSSAIAAMVAQNTGAGEYQRGRKCLRVGLVYSVALSAVIFAVFLLFPREIISLFSRDADIVANGVAYMHYYKVDMLCCALLFCLAGYINGTGHTRYTMVMNLLSSFAIRLPMICLIGTLAGATLREVGFAVPAATLVQVLIGVAFLFFAKSEREQRKALRAQEK